MLRPPIKPMLAKLSESLPEGEGWLYEPKWDGFRALVFRDGDEVYLQSRDLKPLNRYFPELLDDGYHPDKRAMLKIKHTRTADCVVAGFRWHKHGEGIVGSLLLGLYDDEGVLHHVGVTASFKMAERRALAEELAPLRVNA